MSRFRNAAAVFVVRGEGPSLEVLLVERARSLRFFGGYLAAPGGVRHRVDGPDDAAEGDLEALRRCGLRELFEETGLLPRAGEEGLVPYGLEELRRGLIEEKAAAFSAWRETLEREVDRRHLVEICRIRTPPFAPVRYDTVFWLARARPDAKPRLWPGELTSARFWRPADALAAWRRGEVAIVPPVVILLEALRDGDVDAFLKRAAETARAYREGKLHRVRFTPGILMASLTTPTLPPATTTNCLIVGEERLFIVDPASPLPTEQERLFDLLEDLRAEGRELEAILLTHHHPDHVGGVAATSQRFDLPVVGHPLTLSRLAEAVRLGEPLHDGDRIDLGRAPDGSPGWTLEALFTPGHDRGHLCFQESRYRALIAGDMVSTLSTIVIDPPEGHLQTYLDSLERLLGREVGTLYPAHGPAFLDGPALLKHYLAHRRRRHRKLRHAVAQGRGTIKELLEVVYDDVDEAQHPLAARSLLAGLEKLREDGEAVEENGRWTWVSNG